MPVGDRSPFCDLYDQVIHTAHRCSRKPGTETAVVSDLSDLTADSAKVTGLAKAATAASGLVAEASPAAVVVMVSGLAAATASASDEIPTAAEDQVRAAFRREVPKWPLVHRTPPISSVSTSAVPLGHCIFSPACHNTD